MSHSGAKTLRMLEVMQMGSAARRTLGRALLAGLVLSAQTARAQVADPAGSGVIAGALGWLQGTLLGTVATVAAVIAVAGVGYMTLSGRMNWRHAATVVLGCFILFGAAAIVAGIRQTAAGF